MPIHGGKRFGAGRPKGTLAAHTIEASEARKLFVQRVVDEWAPIVDALVEAAKNGNVKVAQYLIDQVAGKPKETLEGAEDPADEILNQVLSEHFLEATRKFEMEKLQKGS